MKTAVKMHARKQILVAVCAWYWLLCYSEFPAATGLPQPEESVEWKFHRTLYDYRSYGAVSTERIDIPPHTVAVNLSFNVMGSYHDCPLKHVKIYANQFGFPVVSRNEEEFPSSVYVSDKTVLNTSVASDNKTVLWNLDNLMEGQIFLIAVMPPPDSKIKQQGLGKKCDYFMTAQARIIYNLEEHIPQILFNSSTFISVENGSQSILRLKVPADTASYTLRLDCKSRQCPVNVSLFETLSLGDNGAMKWDGEWKNDSYLIKVESPAVDSYNYLELITDKESVNLTVLVESTFCDMNHTINGVQTTKLEAKPRFCIFAGDLGRETPSGAEEGSNFYDHFIVWDKNFFPRSLIDVKTLDTTSVVTRFKLRTTDTGSSLKVQLHLPVEKSSPLADIFLCLSRQRVFGARECKEGASLNVTSVEGENSQHMIIPYPQSGLWFISLQSQCYQQDKNSSQKTPVPCKQIPVSNLTVSLSPCIDGGCGRYGACKVYFGADILYSACNCYSGWRGYGCNDGSKADSATIEKTAVYLLTLSNLGFIPGICLALYRRFYVEALVYGYNMFFSTFYHACDTSEIYQLCIMPYNALSFADFFASLLSFWVTLMAMARIPTGLRSFFHMISALFVSLGEVYNRHGLLEQLWPIVGGVTIVIVSWGIEAFKRKLIFPSKRRLLKFILPGVSLACLGLIFNLALETEENYKYIHSMWHLLVSGSIIFLLPPRRGQKGKAKRLSIQSGDITRHVLLENSDFQANIHRADDTSTGASLEPSSPPETPANNRERGFKLLNRNQRNQNLVL